MEEDHDTIKGAPGLSPPPSLPLPLPRPLHLDHSTLSAVSVASTHMSDKPYLTLHNGRRVSVLRTHYQAKEWTVRRRIFAGSVGLILVYLALSVGLYGFWLEKWGAVHSLYFGVVTLTTVGFGDVTPHGQRNRLVTVFYMLFGAWCLCGGGVGEGGKGIGKGSGGEREASLDGVLTLTNIHTLFKS